MNVAIGIIRGVALGTALFAGAAGRLPRPQRPSSERHRLLAAATVSAAVEELLWRGVALRLLDRRRPRIALGATSAAFALAHVGTARARGLATHLVLGAAFGAAARRRGGLVAAVAAHATYDLLVLLDPAPT